MSFFSDPPASSAEPTGQSSSDEDNNKENSSCFIGNLSWTVTSEALKSYLNEAGAVVNCQVMRNQNGQSKGFGLATFADPAAARNAIAKFHDVEHEGRRLVVRLDEPREKRPVRPPRARREPRQVDPCERVFCGNLPFATTQDQFEAIFASAGAQYATLKVNENGASRGYGVVGFETVEQATAAIARFQGLDVDGRPLRCNYDAPPRKQQNRPETTGESSNQT